jgi:hypothetical protein
MANGAIVRWSIVVSNKSIAIVATMGIDIAGPKRRGAIMLR